MWHVSSRSGVATLRTAMLHLLLVYILPFQAHIATRGQSVAAARAYHHVAVLLQNDVRAVVEVEDGDGGELGGRAARLRHRQRLGEVRQRLHDGVVGGVHLGVQRERALAVAVECRVALRRYDPVLRQHRRRKEITTKTTKTVA